MNEIEILQFSEPMYPRQGEQYRNNFGEIKLALREEYTEKHPIVTRHRIEAPEGATEIIVYARFGKMAQNELVATIPLTPPKPVRCRWVVLFSDLSLQTTGLFTREEVTKLFDGVTTKAFSLEPIPGTEEP
jgi:hypothetical protein